MNKTFKKIFSVCCAVITTLTATLFHSTNLKADGQEHKIVFAGPQSAGKTKLVTSICGCSYNSNYAATIGADFASASQIQIWDTSGNSRFLNVMNAYFWGAHLCVLSISNKNQETEDFLNILAKYDVPNVVVLCITKTDEGIPASEEVNSLLDTVKQKFPQVGVFDEVLYTSAKNNTFKFCTPDKYTTSNGYQIYDTEKYENVLAAKLYELCERKAKDSQDDIYRQPVSFGNSGYNEQLRKGTSKKDYSSESNSAYNNSHLAPNETKPPQNYLEQNSFTEKPTPTTGKKYALGLGIPATLLTLILGIGYYEYDRHFRTPVKTKTKPNPAAVSAK